MVTPSNSFCSAPTLRSHLSSVVDSVWPAMKLVPVSAMLELRRLVGLVAARRAADDAGHRHDALLDHVVAVLQVSEYCSLSGTDLLKEVPSLLCSCAGIDAGFDRGLVPDRADAGRGDRRPGGAGGLRQAAAIGESFPPAVPTSSRAAARATVMSAPIRVSQNGETDCFTDTAEAPFALSLDDQVASPLGAALRAARAFGAGPAVRVEASTLSWLQSSLLTSMSFRMSASSASARSGFRRLGASASASRRPAASAREPRASRPS